MTQSHRDLSLGIKQNQSTSIADKEQDEPLEDKFEELFEQYASQVVQDPESKSCNNFENEIEDYCKRAIEDLRVELAQKEIPLVTSILSKLQEGTTKVMDMLRKVKGLRNELKDSADQLSEPKEKANSKDEDLSKDRKAWFGNDRKSSRLFQSLSDEVEDLLEKKLKYNFGNRKRPKL
jgi:hypothetical protein